jgi:Flp pilus assembly protein TadG
VTRWQRLRAHPERGAAAAVETAIILPLVLLIMLAVAAAGRVSNARDATEQAARAASRIASSERSPATATVAATGAAAEELRRQGLSCMSIDVAVNGQGLSAPLGQDAAVTATVTCRVSLSELAFPGVPGDQTVTATFTSPVDPNRERS